MKNIQVSEMASEITEMLTTYGEDVTRLAKEVVDEMANEVNKQVQSHITFKDRVYSKNFKITKSFEDDRNKRVTWHVKAPYYRLTHLLEYGHLNRDGSRTRAFPHVKYGEEYLEDNFERRIKEGIENARFERNT